MASAQGFSIGICASDSAPRLHSLLSFLRSEHYGADFELRKIVVVASGCPRSIISDVEESAHSDSRIQLISEDRRRGKAEAINRILKHSSGEHLVMVNADAFPEPGSIGQMLKVVSDPSVGAVSAMPTFDDRGGLLKHSLSLMWSAHSVLSLRLNHAGISNHSCDELMVVRKSLVSSLPANLVNDGAYIGGLVRSQGFKVKFSSAAKVRIVVPRTLVDLIRQRRRIIYGHVQVWRKLGRPPKTIESMMLIDPLVSLKTLVSVLSERPRLITAVPVVLAGELLSIVTGLTDALRSTERHAVWRRNVE